MRYLLFLGCCVLYLVGSTLNAQIGSRSESNAPSGVVTGFITDSNSEQPLAGVNVLIQGINLGDATSIDGRYLIRNVPVGAHTLVISRIGHQSLKREFSISNGQNVTLDFQLTVLAVLFDEIIVERTSLIGNKDRIFKIPGSAHYLDSKDLAEFEYNDIHRALQAIPGINIQEEDGYGLRPNIGFRGTGSERSSKITIMEDGILQAPAPYSAPAAYYFPTVGRMRAIEVRKGSSQIKYGPFTTGGALNLISTAIPHKFDGYVEFFAGPDEYRRIHATAGNSSKNFGFLAETFQAKTDGFKELDSGGDTGFDKKDYVLKFRFNTNPNASVYQQLTFKFAQTDETSDETYLGLTDADFESNPLRRYTASRNDVIDTEQTQLVVRHFIKPTQSLDVTSSFYRTDFQRNWYKLDRIRATQEGPRTRIADILADPVTYAPEYNIATGQSSLNDNALEVKANNREYYAWGFQTHAAMQFKAFGGAQEAEVGIRYHEDQVDRFQWVDLFKMDNGIMELTGPGTPGTESNRISAAKVWAGYVQLTLNFGQVTVVPGIRYETMNLTRADYGIKDPERTGINMSSRDNNVNALIPGIGFDYRFSLGFSSFFSVHKGFAPPGSREGTQPESSINYEVGTRFVRANFNFQGVFFLNDYSNLLGSDLVASGGEGSGDQFNGGEVDARGLELSFNYHFGTRTKTAHIGIPLRVAYTFTDTEFKNAFDSKFNPWGKVAKGDELPYVPKHQLFASIGLEGQRIGATLGAKYTGQMRTVAGQGDFADALSTNAHVVFDLSADFAITNANKVFVTVRNLLNEKYIAARRPAGARPGLPRTFLAGVKADF